MIQPLDWAQTISTSLRSAITDWDQARDRSQQTREHILGVSDIGNCREYARLLTTETPFSDTDKNMLPAIVGTWIHDGVTKAIHQSHATWITDVAVDITLPSGATLTGHPDFVIPGWGVIDLKTKPGLESVKRYGPSQQQVFQVALYALGCVQAGLLADDGNLNLAVAWLDRTGFDPDPHVVVFSYDESLIRAAEEWISDVVYAVQHGEQASKDKPYEWCRDWCNYFTVCRGHEANPEGGLITDEEQIRAVDLYADGQRLKAQAVRMMEQAKAELDGVQGSTGTYNVKWTVVGESEVPALTRRGYKKLTITQIKPRG